LPWFKIHSRSDHKTQCDSAIIDANAGTHSRIKARPPTSGNWPREVDMSIPKFIPSGEPHNNIQRRKSTISDDRTPQQRSFSEITVLRTTDTHQPTDRRKLTIGDNRTPLHRSFSDKTVVRTTDAHQPTRRRKSTHSDTRTLLHRSFSDKTVLCTTDAHQPTDRRKSTIGDNRIPLHRSFSDNTVMRTTDVHQPSRRRKLTHSDTRTSLQMGILDKIVTKPNMSSSVAFYLNVIAKQQLLNLKIKKQRDKKNRLVVCQNKQQQLQHVMLHSLSICSKRLVTAKRVYTVILVLCQLCVLANIYIMCCHL